MNNRIIFCVKVIKWITIKDMKGFKPDLIYVRSISFSSLS
jgi:hypothetical protein